MFNLEGRTIGFFLARWIGYRPPESLDTTVHPPSWWTLFHRTWNWARTIIHSSVKTMIIFALQLYIGAELSEEIIGGGICPQRGESASVEGAQKLSNERSSSSFYFGGSRLPPSPFPLPFLFLPLFRAKPRRISSMRGSWKDEVESGRPAYGLINHGMIEERMNVKWKFVGVGLGINRGWGVNVWGVKILIIIIYNNYF